MEAMLKQSDLMEIMKVSRSTLWRILRNDDFPKPVILMRCQRWRREDIESYLIKKSQE